MMLCLKNGSTASLSLFIRKVPSMTSTITGALHNWKEVFRKVLTRRLLQHIVPHMVPETQCSFLPGCSNEDLIFVVPQVFKKATPPCMPPLLTSVKPLTQWSGPPLACSFGARNPSQDDGSPAKPPPGHGRLCPVYE